MRTNEIYYSRFYLNYTKLAMLLTKVYTRKNKINSANTLPAMEIVPRTY